MPHGEDTARDFCSYPFQGFDVDGRCCYLFEGAGNGNKPANGPPMHASPSPRSTAGSSIGVFPSGPTPISKDFVCWG